MSLYKQYKQYQFPGATAAFILPDGTTGIVAVGMDDVKNEIPMYSDSRMLAASIGKPFVGAALMALAGEGRLSLDDSILTWLDDREWVARLPNHIKPHECNLFV
jgi:D-alanyl-D-alanine carboxypeptidase